MINRFINHRLKILKPIDLLLLSLCLILSLSFGLVYVSAEHYFYYWDYSGYQAIAARVARDFLTSPAIMLKDVRDSINYEYNFFYAAPLIPFLLNFTTSRLAYISGLFLIYQVPYALILGAIATRSIKAPARPVFWSTVLLAFLTPMFVAPTLRGYPDVSAALMIALAVWLYLIDIRLVKGFQSIGIGLCLAMAMLLRRHYIYDAAIILLSITWIQLILFFSSRKAKLPGSLRNLFIAGFKIGLIVGTLILVLLVFGRPYLTRLFASDYRALYQSYSSPPITLLRMFTSYYGWTTLLLAILGFSLGMYHRVLNRIPGIFLIMLGLVSWFTWVVVIRYYATHFTLHLTFIIVLGISALFRTAWKTLRGKKRALALSGLAILLIVNISIHLTPISLPSKFSNLFPLRYPPLVRQDYADVVGLISFLRKNVSPGEAIFMVDSSPAMNDDLLRNAERALHADPFLNILRTPQIDSRDFYPLEQLLQAKYILVSTPYQHILPDPDEQKVSRVVSDGFKDGWEFSKDFQLLPRRFKLADGVVLKVYQRVQPTSTETALRTFADILAYVNRRPGQQPDWIVLNRPDGLRWTGNDGSAYQLEFDIRNHDTISPAVALLSVDPLSGGFSVRLGISSLVDNCPSAQLVLQSIDSSGQPILTEEIDLSESFPADWATVQFNDPRLQYLLLTIDVPSGETCAADLAWNLDRASP